MPSLENPKNKWRCSDQASEKRYQLVLRIDFLVALTAGFGLSPVCSVWLATYLSVASRTTQAKDTFFCFARSSRLR
jgi:uncharacterized membrane protein